MEKGHQAARMDYSCLDVELDLTIQFKMSDDAENLKIPVSEASIRECFYLRKGAFESRVRRKGHETGIQSSRLGKEPLHVIILGWAIVSNNRSLIVDHLRT